MGLLAAGWLANVLDRVLFGYKQVVEGAACFRHSC